MANADKNTREWRLVDHGIGDNRFEAATHRRTCGLDRRPRVWLLATNSPHCLCPGGTVPPQRTGEGGDFGVDRPMDRALLDGEGRPEDPDDAGVDHAHRTDRRRQRARERERKPATVVFEPRLPRTARIVPLEFDPHGDIPPCDQNLSPTGAISDDRGRRTVIGAQLQPHRFPHS